MLTPIFFSTAACVMYYYLKTAFPLLAVLFICLCALGFCNLLLLYELVFGLSYLGQECRLPLRLSGGNYGSAAQDADLLSLGVPFGPPASPTLSDPWPDPNHLGGLAIGDLHWSPA